MDDASKYLDSFGILIVVFQHLDPYSLVSASRVSKSWNKAANSESVWFRICIREGVSGQVADEETVNKILQSSPFYIESGNVISGKHLHVKRHEL